MMTPKKLLFPIEPIKDSGPLETILITGHVGITVGHYKQQTCWCNYSVQHSLAKPF